MVGDGCQISHDSLNPSCKLKRESWDGATDGDVMDQKLIMILTETEKRTALIGRWFRRLQFARVDLAGAVFRKANLEGTRFMLADLHEADFRQANLRGAEFSLCDLYGADFTDACLEKATFHRSVGLSSALRTYIRSHGGVVSDVSDKDLTCGRKMV